MFSTYNLHPVIRYIPKIMHNQIHNRVHGSFLLVLRGIFQYSFESNCIRISNGESLYLPNGASYCYDILSSSALCIQMDFDFLDQNGDPVFLSQFPVKLRKMRGIELQNLFDAMSEREEDTNDESVLVTDGIARILYANVLHSLRKDNIHENLILESMLYLRTQFRENLSIHELAQRAFMSESQFRRRFYKEAGISPLQYREMHRMQRACALLLDTTLSIGEIADALGFGNAFAFSQRFRNHFDQSPSAYRRLESESQKQDRK